MSRNNLISVSNLNKTFGDKRVLKDINFNVLKRESFVIIGGSGSGKSVLLKCLAGLLNPDEGSKIIIDNEFVTHTHIIQRKKFIKKFSMLFQSNALFDSLPVWHNICFSLINSGILNIERAKQHAVEMLELVGLNEEIVELYPASLSGGMQKRVAIARAIAVNPEIIFLDEPTSGLDPVMSDTITTLIKSISKKLKSTTITITHDVKVMKKIADRVALLKEGEIFWIDTLKNTVNSDNEYVKLFLNK
ncbi:ABC transporter ATP-binding protein [Rickettsiales endosymbiont of Trichoplax sp. H2]|uniref:ABC transporter ATP-binding protein n=1 Tax=Rickettsiales endosymbiont of Trichoplax sp. H2 TaxID=2021221 RepID=UPI0012B26BF8|nr:ATP-binding cassette domain-containing protein [Rickettsiales endosymbiont of Trichoplax sp. H2]MSO13946.1 Methionine import ATP-binding protein MetN [Rickettsiales endosymbiont of Trichoplax sp. H2]